MSYKTKNGLNIYVKIVSSIIKYNKEEYYFKVIKSKPIRPV